MTIRAETSRSTHWQGGGIQAYNVAVPTVKHTCMKILPHIARVASSAGLAVSLVIGGNLQAQADLGDAEKVVYNAAYDAYCGEKGHKCKVLFIGDRLVVDSGSGVSFRDMREIWYHVYKGFFDPDPTYIYDVTYLKADGTEATGKFLFVNSGASQKFWNSLQLFARRNASTKVYVDDDRRQVGDSVLIK